MYFDTDILLKKKNISIWFSVSHIIWVLYNLFTLRNGNGIPHTITGSLVWCFAWPVPAGPSSPIGLTHLTQLQGKWSEKWHHEVGVW